VSSSNAAWGREKHPIIFMAIPDLTPAMNPYLHQLVSDLRARGVTVQFMNGWRSVLAARNLTAFHVHWPEVLVRRATGARLSPFRLLWALIGLLTLVVRRVPIVWTRHNLRPHESAGMLENAFLAVFSNLVTVQVYLNESTENEISKGLVIVHPDYRAWFGVDVRPPSTPRRQTGLIACPGILRPYKGLEALIASFRAEPEASRCLVIGGRADSPDYAALLVQRAQGDERIEVRARHLEDPELVLLLTTAALVALPYPSMYNSGVALLALSFGAPLLVPANAATLTLQIDYPDFVFFFEAPLTARALQQALTDASDAPRVALSPPRRSAETTADLHVALLALLGHTRRSRRAWRQAASGEQAFAAHSTRNHWR
jgi:beta-1,4-mannosyltransferase